jgi:hypothetical protein
MVDLLLSGRRPMFDNATAREEMVADSLDGRCLNQVVQDLTGVRIRIQTANEGGNRQSRSLRFFIGRGRPFERYSGR